MYLPGLMSEYLRQDAGTYLDRVSPCLNTRLQIYARNHPTLLLQLETTTGSTGQADAIKKQRQSMIRVGTQYAIQQQVHLTHFVENHAPTPNKTPFYSPTRFSDYFLIHLQPKLSLRSLRTALLSTFASRKPKGRESCSHPWRNGGSTAYLVSVSGVRPVYVT